MTATDDIAELLVRHAGPHVSVQDDGRPGLMRYGVPQSGPMDRLAFAAANLALGNPADAPGIEVSMGGLVLECRSGAVGFAVAGGGFILDHAGQRRGSWQVATLRAGEVLTIRPGHWGSWCHLALAGQLQGPEFQAAEFLGSLSTHAISNLGGGRLVAGQCLHLASTRKQPDRDLPCPVSARPRNRIRVVMGPQQQFFAPATIRDFLTGPWRMTDAWDRMGVRLSGPKIAPDGALDIPSAPILRGSVQVAGDGVATILLADHQTTGGYPRIATVLDCDLDALMQLRPRDPLLFYPVTADEALGIARTAAQARAGYLESLVAAR